jgi:hypothetical protein
MDTSHWLLLELIAVTGTPLVLFPLVAIVLAWRSVKHRALYVLLAFLTLAGLTNFLNAIIRAIVNPPAGPSTYPSANFTVLFSVAVLVALIGFPILWWLRNTLRNT